SLLLCDRRLGPAFGRFRKFPRGKTPEDNFLFCEVSGVFQTAAIKIQANRRRSRAARADEVGSESEFLRELIQQTGVLREKIVKDERVTVAEKKHRAVCIRLDRGTGPFFTDDADRNFFRSRLLSVVSQQSGEVAVDLHFFP